MQENPSLRYSIGGVVFVSQFTGIVGAFPFEVGDDAVFRVTYVNDIAQVVVAEVGGATFGVGPTGDTPKAVVFTAFRVIVGSGVVSCCVVGLATDITVLVSLLNSLDKPAEAVVTVAVAKGGIVDLGQLVSCLNYRNRARSARGNFRLQRNSRILPQYQARSL